MPETISNTQTQQNTTSDDGRNVRPALICDSHFFIESIGSNTFQQDEDEKFGVVSDTVFRTTAKITFTGVKKIFAVCDGQVFIQPQIGNSEKINLILKPYRQPIKEIPIKYFIYRGLNKVDFITVSGENKLIAGNVSDGTQFVRHIHTEFRDFFQNANIPEPYPLFLAKMIGYSEEDDQQLTDSIDSYFFKITQQDEEDSNTAYEFPVIPKGIHLGNAQVDFGIDIVLNNGDYYIENDPNPFQLNLKFARAVEGILDTALVTDSSQEIQSFKRKLLKENCTQFIDPAAFYGLHCNGYGKLTVTTDNGGTTTVLTDKIEIFNHFKYFHTKHTQYLYIQSNRQRSYNFYGNYKYSETNQNNIKIGINNQNFIEKQYGTQGWPLEAILPAIQTENEFTILKFQLTTDRNENISLFSTVSEILSPNDEGFIDSANLLLPPDEQGVFSFFTQIVHIKSHISNVGETISSLNLFLYNGKNMYVPLPIVDDGNAETPPPEQTFFLLNYRDDVFDLLMTVPLEIGTDVPNCISLTPKLYNMKNANPKNSNVVSFTRRTQKDIIISESQNVILFTYLANVIQFQSPHLDINQNPSSNKLSTGFNHSKDFYTLPSLSQNELIRLNIITDSSQIITAFTLQTSDGSLPTSMVLGIDSDENLLMKALSEGKHNPKIILKPFYEDNNIFISPENIKYQKFSLGILYEEEEGNIRIDLPENEIIVYSIDNLIFTSKNYGDYIVSEYKSNIVYIIPEIEN